MEGSFSDSGPRADASSPEIAEFADSALRSAVSRAGSGVPVVPSDGPSAFCGGAADSDFAWGGGDWPPEGASALEGDELGDEVGV
jgi:hypothetical protein